MLRKVSGSYITYLVNMEALNDSLTVSSDNLNTLKQSSFQWKILRCDAALLNVFRALFNDAVSNSDYIASNGRIIDER
jgi:hypothetical protein